MGSTPLEAKPPRRLYNHPFAPSLDDFREICSRRTTVQDAPSAISIKSDIPIYDLPPELLASNDLETLKDEWNHVLLNGPGVFVVKHLYRDMELIDRVNMVFDSIITEESALGQGGDHFATSGTNSRIWNSLEKHCTRDPQSFAEYYSNPWLAAICDAWLGPGYRVTAQVNIVRPGGNPQVCHRDYHLGFMTEEQCGRFPRAMQTASQLLTLQGAVAHTDMPVVSGPTRVLPYSQTFESGYMAYRREEFNKYFLENYVSLPLEKGDGLFFSPALFHAAGENSTTNFSRSANLLQISSAFGKPMETVHTPALIEATFDHLKDMYTQEGGITPRIQALITAISEGYSFPTNLDQKPPTPNGMSSDSEGDTLTRMLVEGCERSEVLRALNAMRMSSR